MNSYIVAASRRFISLGFALLASLLLGRQRGGNSSFEVLAAGSRHIAPATAAMVAWSRPRWRLRHLLSARDSLIPRPFCSGDCLAKLRSMLEPQQSSGCWFALRAQAGYAQRNSLRGRQGGCLALAGRGRRVCVSTQRRSHSAGDRDLLIVQKIISATE